LAWAGLAAQVSNNPIVKKAGAVAGVLGGIVWTVELLELSKWRDWHQNRLWALEEIAEQPVTVRTLVNVQGVLNSPVFQRLINARVDQVTQERLEQKENAFLRALPDNVANLLNNPGFNQKLADLIAQQMPAESAKSLQLINAMVKRYAQSTYRSIIAHEKARSDAEMVHGRVRTEAIAQLPQMISDFTRASKEHSRQVSALLLALPPTPASDEQEEGKEHSRVQSDAAPASAPLALEPTQDNKPDQLGE
jgi:hypothetical protein